LGLCCGQRAWTELNNRRKKIAKSLTGLKANLDTLKGACGRTLWSIREAITQKVACSSPPRGARGLQRQHIGGAITFKRQRVSHGCLAGVDGMFKKDWVLNACSPH